MAKNDRPDTFNEYLYTLSDEQRAAVLKNLSKHGEPNAVLKELMYMPVYCQNKKYEVRINERFILWYEKKTLFKQPRAILLKVDSYTGCYHSYGPGSGDSILGIVGENGLVREFDYVDNGDAAVIFEKLTGYFRQFEKLAAENTQVSQEEVKLTSATESAYYFLKGNTLSIRRIGAFSKKVKDTVCVADIRDIAWCVQWYIPDSEAADTYDLHLYLGNQKKPVRIFCDSTREAFQAAMELKKRVPHMLYGPGKEYEKIFQKDPAALMALAKSKQYEKIQQNKS